ncbi:MAG: KOW domain-containing RNA-binding protein [Clostridia bacterium]|jgi:ribosomal protein L14E/L6E/L27E|nr:KOW domain-containing RNA-binding protein [Clostridia bacterium]
MVGKIVISKKGRDMGKYLAVINCDKNYVFVADGKERKLETPKRKNIKHISITADTLTKDQMKTNKQLKKAIAVYKDTVALKEEP